MYLATVLMEPHRWQPGKAPVFAWGADTGERIARAGFTGIELWWKHWALAPAEAQKQIAASACPVRILNWYGIPGDESEPALLSAVGELSATLAGIKFNLGKDPARFAEEVAATARLAERLPSGVRLLCECHAGLSAGTPEQAREAFESWPATVGAMMHPFDETGADAWLAALGPRIVHLHLQARRQGEWLDPVPGIPQVEEGLRLLRRHGFSGTASLEFIAAIATEQDPLRLLDAAASVRAAWDGREPWRP